MEEPDPTPVGPEQLMTVPEVAEYLQVTRKSVYRWVDKGEIPYVKVGGVLRFKPEDLPRKALARQHAKMAVYRRKGYWHAMCRCGWETEPHDFKQEAVRAVEAHIALEHSLAGL